MDKADDGNAGVKDGVDDSEVLSLERPRELRRFVDRQLHFVLVARRHRQLDVIIQVAALEVEAGQRRAEHDHVFDVQRPHQLPHVAVNLLLDLPPNSARRLQIRQ